MDPTFFTQALAYLALFGGPATPVEPSAPPPPRVVRWPGGYLYQNGPEVVLEHRDGTGRSTNVISGSGNGVGNTIVVDNGGRGGVTVIRNSRNGYGNRLVLDPDDWLLDLDALTPRPQPARFYRGKDNRFWTAKVWSDDHDCPLYWCGKSKKWFRYHKDGDVYKPVANGPAPPMTEER